MTVIFGRLGRVSMLVGVTAAVITLIGLAVLDGGAATAVTSSVGVIAVLGLVHGVVWAVVQHRMFGSIATLKRVAATGAPTTATIVGVKSTSSKIGAEPIVRLDLMTHGQPVRQHVRVPSTTPPR